MAKSAAAGMLAHAAAAGDPTAADGGKGKKEKKEKKKKEKKEKKEKKKKEKKKKKKKKGGDPVPAEDSEQQGEAAPADHENEGQVRRSTPLRCAAALRTPFAILRFCTL